jgi:peptide/nickel transport system ATP-binding protein
MTVQVEHLSLRLGAFALEDVGFTLGGGETLVILGPSGAGKSTLLETLAGFYRPDCGRICIDGRDVSGALPEARRIGFMFQDYALFPHLTVAQNIQFGMRRADAERTRALLSRFGLSQLAQRRPHQLSGGEQQRTALARALALDPEVIICDEAVSALDVLVQAQVLNLLADLQANLGLTYLFITHDLAVVRQIADHVCVMEKGRLVETGSTDDVFESPQQDYTKALLNAIPGAKLMLPPEVA